MLPISVVEGFKELVRHLFEEKKDQLKDKLARTNKLPLITECVCVFS